jgi:predicted enzyme related to lactoylglutathione lyase
MRRSWLEGDGALATPVPDTEHSMFKKVAFTMYPVKDSARARQFYETTLGLTRGSSASNGVWTEYDLPGGGCLALFQTGDIAPSAAAGGSVALEVDDLDALTARLKAEGVSFKADGIVSPVCRMAVILDSEGNAIILHQLNPT